jgi:hypothetical protein
VAEYKPGFYICHGVKIPQLHLYPSGYNVLGDFWGDGDGNVAVFRGNKVTAVGVPGIFSHFAPYAVQKSYLKGGVIFNVVHAETKRSVRIFVCKSFLSASQ